jgi:hypothetical protein
VARRGLAPVKWIPHSVHIRAYLTPRALTL